MSDRGDYMSNLDRAYILIGSFLAIIVLCFGLTYLLWSFMHADFNFWKWGGFSRTIMVLISVVLTVVCGCVTVSFFNEYTKILDFDD
jgi:hypothetical protein